MGLFLLIYPLIFFSRTVINLFNIGVNSAFLDAVEVTCFSLCAGFLPMLVLWLLLVSGQAIVPINSMNERIRTAWHMFLFMLNRHGVATAVRDGAIQSARPLVVGPPGLLVIDFNSAVVVEENIPIPDIVKTFRNMWRSFLISIGLMETPETPRVFGPGLAFMRPGAYIHTVVDLRRQFRLRPGVSAYTRDGIEVKTNIWALFRVGYDHNVLPLSFTLANREDPNSLQLVELRETADHRVAINRVASDFRAELDPEDWAQICETFSNPENITNCFRYNMQPQAAHIPVFNSHNVFSAAFSDALDEEGRVIPWAELPVKVAADIYRQVLLEYNYDELYGTVEQQLALERDLMESQALTIFRIRRILRTRVRNNGLLFFRLIQCGRRPLEAGQIYSPNELVTSQVFPMTASRVLRNAGITVIFNGFGDLTPVSERVYQQRLDTWRARWYESVKEVETSREIQAIQQTTQARLQTQEDLAYRLRQIMENTAQEPIGAAMQVLMELETLANDPMTRRLLPQETIMLMRMLHDWTDPERGKGLLTNGIGGQ